MDRSKEESASKVEWLEISITMRAAKVKWEIYKMVVRLSLMYGLEMETGAGDFEDAKIFCWG